MKKKAGAAYDAKDVEKRILQFWEKEKIYRFNPAARGKIYSIDTPPPTVSGKMHIGHALSYAQEDFIARFRRMSEGNLFYPFGTDDNGLPTERLVERINSVRGKEMARSDFIRICLETLKKITPDFIQDWKNLGISADYNLCYSTIDENSRRISQKSFIGLFNKKRIYEKDFPTIWCPECQTAVAQAELEDRQESSLFSTIKFRLGNKELFVATTRPELLPACVAVFVHPDDKRHKFIIGKKASVPLFEYEVPVIADKSAEIGKGTGVLMICSYGDRFDVDSINKHKLKPRLVLESDGRLNELAGKYKGMKVLEAREKILQDLMDFGLITKQEKIIHAVNTHDKCGTPIEFITTVQWFIKILDKKTQLIKQGRKVKWHPAYMLKRYENWVKGLEWDWSISRDRHFGIPIPVWKCGKCGQIILPKEKELPIDPIQVKKECPKCRVTAKPEEKVLDTWATSSLTPQLAGSLADGKIKIPFSLRPQGHDIIRTWAFYTIVKSYLHQNKIPWKDAMVSGFVTLEGKKMSKSKGNVIEPQQVLEQYGADALRFWAAGSRLGEDLDYQEQDLVAGKRFLTKLWNASRFVFMNLKGFKPGNKPKKLEKIDLQFLANLSQLVKSSTKSFREYEYSKAKNEAEKFFWHEFCDNYLEIVKNRVYNTKGNSRKSAQYSLYYSLLTLLKLIAPITPFITEEIYQQYYRKNEKVKSIHISKWADAENFGKDTGIWGKITEILQKVREEKSKAKKSVKAEIILTIESKDKKLLKSALGDLGSVCSAKEIREGKFRVEFC